MTTFRAGSWGANPLAGGKPHGEVLGRTIGIIGYGRIGREVAVRATGLRCRVLATNRSQVAEKGAADAVFPIADLDQMLPQCDTVVIACALVPETQGLIDARRLVLMKPEALLINIARGPIVDEDALYAALKNRALGGAAIAFIEVPSVDPTNCTRSFPNRRGRWIRPSWSDAWWQYSTPAEPERRPSRHPFHELSNVLMTPHCSAFTDGTAERRWRSVASNLDRFACDASLDNVIVRT